VNAGTLNTVKLTGEISDIASLRHTPGGLPLMNFRLLHRSMQIEAGIERQTECEVGAVAIGDVASAVAAFKAGDSVTVEGFLAAKRRMGAQLGTQLVLHIQQIKQIKQT
jgi:primosomal replication protein N